MVYIIGGGISGLVSAYQAVMAVGGENVTIIEKERELGGVLRGVFYPEDELYFDNGTHIFRMTGIHDLDELISLAIGKDETNYFERVNIGSVYQFALQKNSHYPDIRNSHLKCDLIESIEQNIHSKYFTLDINYSEPLKSACIKRFGNLYTDKILLPAMSGFFRVRPEVLSAQALTLSGLTRCVAFSKDDWVSKASCSKFRALFAYPNQEEMPSEYANKLKQLYPKNGGTNSLVIGFKKLLKDLNVKIETNANNLKIDHQNGCLQYINNNNDSVICDNCCQIILANGIIGAASVLGIPIPIFTKTPQLAFLHILFDKPLESNTSYFCNFNLEYPIFRVTNYRMMTLNPDDRRVTVELLVDDLNEIPEIDIVVEHLRSLNFVTDHSVVFSNFTKLKGHFPFPALSNYVQLSNLNSELNEITLAPNLLLLNSVTGPAFFQNDLTIRAFIETPKFIKKMHSV
jgi:oxygen-dependent protoporphyrinogen oxidase